MAFHVHSSSGPHQFKRGIPDPFGRFETKAQIWWLLKIKDLDSEP
jgi:hypothetical protein